MKANAMNNSQIDSAKAMSREELIALADQVLSEFENLHGLMAGVLDQGIQAKAA